MASLIAFGVFMPLLLMTLNLQGFSRLETESFNKMNADDFNLFSFSGFGTAISFFFNLGKFTVSNMPPLINGLFVFMGLFGIAIGVLIARS